MLHDFGLSLNILVLVMMVFYLLNIRDTKLPTEGWISAGLLATPVVKFDISVYVSTMRWLGESLKCVNAVKSCCFPPMELIIMWDLLFHSLLHFSLFSVMSIKFFLDMKTHHHFIFLSFFYCSWNLCPFIYLLVCHIFLLAIL